MHEERPTSGGGCQLGRLRSAATVFFSAASATEHNGRPDVARRVNDTRFESSFLDLHGIL
jgi:hypothetical protein